MRAVRAVVASAALALLVGCGSGSSPEAPKLLTRAEADARTVVPFTRGVRLDKAGRIVDVTFDAPAVVDPQMPWLKLGLRLQGQDEEALSKAADSLREGALKVRVHLDRLDRKNAGAVILSRSSDDGRDWVPIPNDGHVDRVSPATVDTYPLIEAGLHSRDVSYRTLEMADAGLIDAGRYRVTVDAVDDRPEFRNLQVEFIAAYYSLGK
ncbi:hypothetical protein [Stenotrophomonas sp.]|uniref:hypothetical protein n=1 Tax=Stenotrophomonas sp. TaxID=69392 RepID=UPI0028AB5BC7|nr:hypothetical protein [Stenotrophomonas sp.]